MAVGKDGGGGVDEGSLIGELRERVEMVLGNGSSRYDAASLSLLTDMVDQQMTSGSYHLDNNLSVLTLFSLYPPCFDFGCARKILIKALTQLPNNDFNDCLSLIPENYQKDERLLRLIKLEELLQSCRFKQVWEEIKHDTAGLGGDLAALPGFTDSLRRFICEVVALTYQSITAADLAALLNLQSSTSWDFERLLRVHGWVVEEVGPLTRRVAVVRVGGGGGGGVKEEAVGGGGQKKGQQKSGGDKTMNPETLRLCFSALRNNN
eukprot:GHVS01076094.1.p1 GENE.GHVS01076094.1~~GHVS01076094.1.p1  ORF type:complete len:264 (+),score=76.84 GHVS01076094.1:208-999(+)